MALCGNCSAEIGDADAFCANCGTARGNADSSWGQQSSMPPPDPGTGWSSTHGNDIPPPHGNDVTQPPTSVPRELKSARGVTMLAALGGVGSLLAVLLSPLSYVVYLSEGGRFDGRTFLNVLINALIFLVPGAFVAVHALGALRKRDLYFERDRLVIAAIAAATVVLLRFGSLARLAVDGYLDAARPEAAIWYQWGLMPVQQGMNPLLHLVGLVVLLSIGAAVVASVWFIADAKLLNIARVSNLVTMQRRGVLMILLALYIQGSQRWDSPKLAIADVLGALFVVVFAFLGGLIGDRAVVIVGIATGAFTLAAILSVIVNGLISQQFDFDGLGRIVIVNGLLVWGCVFRCPVAARWKESLRAPLAFFSPQHLE